MGNYDRQKHKVKDGLLAAMYAFVKTPFPLVSLAKSGTSTGALLNEETVAQLSPLVVPTLAHIVCSVLSLTWKKAGGSERKCDEVDLQTR